MTDVKTTLENLVRLQELESVLASLDAQLGQVPLRLAERERSLGAAEKTLSAAKAELVEAGKARRSLEMDVEAVKATIRRHQDQLMLVKTNEQYRALNKEIAHEKAKIEELEERILLNLERADELGRMVREREASLEQERSRVAAEKAALLEEKGRLEGERAAVSAEHQQVSSKLPQEALALFRRIAELRGTAVARVEGEACGECRVRCRPQAVAEVRSFARLVQCESCRRILFAPAGPDPGDVQSEA